MGRARHHSGIRFGKTRLSNRFCKPYFKSYEQFADATDDLDEGPWQVPELCEAYGWPTNLTGGGKIAIVELDGGWDPSDGDTFFQSIGQPIPQINHISVLGGANNPGQYVGAPDDPDIEVALDIQVAGAAYYAATGQPAVINVYWAPNQPGAIAAAVRAATEDGCSVCSISWGADEATWQDWGAQSGQDFVQDMEDAASAATSAGMVVFASSGDNDSSDGGPTPANVDLPASCPHVIGCGGTSKTRSTETVWNNKPGETDGQGTGGGYSTVFPPQPFQAGAPMGPGRMVPDVAAAADPVNGYQIHVHGEDIVEGGTSAVAPLYAGLFAAFGTQLGFVTPKLWANHLCFNDITEGDNGFYRARQGPDPCTGIGSPIGSKLSGLFAAPAAPEIAASHDAFGLARPDGWSGTISYTYLNGVLVETSTTPMVERTSSDRWGGHRN